MRKSISTKAVSYAHIFQTVILGGIVHKTDLLYILI